MKRRSLLVSVFVCAIALTYLSNCGVLVGNPDEKTGDGKIPTKARVTQPEEAFEPQQSSGLFVHITDAPADNALAVIVKVAGVEAKHEELGWLELPSSEGAEVDLVSLQDGTTLALVDGAQVPEGRYSELRLVLDDSFESYMMLSEGEKVPLKVSGEDGFAIKIKVEFDVVVEESTELVLDFDLRQSIRQLGQAYFLRPVLRAVKKSESGMIVGSAAKGAVACLYPTGIQPDSDAACPGALVSAVAKRKGFTLAFVPEGVYQVQVFESGEITSYSDVVVTSRTTTRLD